MIHLYTALLHHFFQLPIADGIRYIPTHTPKDDVPLELAALEIYDRRFAIGRILASIPIPAEITNFATEPPRERTPKRRAAS